MYIAEITTATTPISKHSYTGIGARRKNGDHIRIFADNLRQCRTLKRILMALAKHYGLPLAQHANFDGIGMIRATNDELLTCLSPFPGDPYSGVDIHAAFVAWRRDFNITNLIMAQDPTIPQLLAVSDNQQDWLLFWRCNCPVPEIREHLARELEECRALRAKSVAMAQRLLARRQANGTAN
jgi:hypothetical protein